MGTRIIGRIIDRITVRITAAISVAILAAVMSTGGAVAGGWAVTTLDPVTDRPVAGRDTPVGFTIRQHGVTPVTVDGTTITITGPGGPRTFPAKAEGPVGHYVADVRFPAAGTWTWEVGQGWFGSQPLGAIQVGDATSSPTASATRRRSVSLPIRMALSLATVASAAWWVGSTRPRRRLERITPPAPHGV